MKVNADYELQRIFERGPVNTDFNLRWFQRTEPIDNVHQAWRGLILLRRKVWAWCYAWGYCPDPATEIYRYQLKYVTTVDTGRIMGYSVLNGSCTYAILAALDGNYSEYSQDDEDIYLPIELEMKKKASLKLLPFANPQ